MDILKENFCVNVLGAMSTDLYTEKANMLYSKYRPIYADRKSPVQYNCFDYPKKSFVGFKNGIARSENKPWSNIISAAMYAHYVDEALKADGGIDNYSII